MCGIAGIVSLDQRPVADADLELLVRRLRHRGPDGEKIWVSPDRRCGLVHLRLAIIDTNERADQPMTSADGKLTIVFNGEIYNFLEIRASLEEKGVRFRTESDSEVLLEAWRMWGPAALDRLNGMWAFAIRDNESGRLSLARDRFGVKPLLYAHRPGMFAFASEMRALVALPQVPDEVDPDVAARLLFSPFGIEASETSLHPAIRRLPAGHYAVLDQGRLAVTRWWRTTDHLPDPPATLAEAAGTFRDLFLDSIKLRMRSDVSIGTCLSGGFDSTAVASAMALVAGRAGSDRPREADDWRHAFVASFPSLSNDETPQARLAAAHAGIEPHILDLGDDLGEAHAEKTLDALDDIYIGLPTAIWKIYGAVRARAIRVSLDGHGADEMIGAYKPHGIQLGYWARHLLGSGGAGRSATAVALGESAKLGGLTLRNHIFLRRHRFAPPRPVPSPAQDDRLPAHWGLLNRRLYGMFHSTVLPTLLRNYDRLSMAHGVEIRMPFMDWRLVTFAMALPDEMKVSRGLTKYVAREAMRGIMPESIRSSPRKVGFNSQMPEWLNGSLGPWAAAIVERKGHPLFDEIVDSAALARRLRGLNDRQAWDWTSAGRLWPYVNLKWYLDRLDGAPPTAGR